MIKRIREFIAAREGNFAVVGSIAMVPLLAGIGVAVDYSSALNQRSQMQDALDAASLMAIGLSPTATATERAKALQDAYQANGGTGKATVVGNLQVSGDLATLNTRAEYSLPTLMLHVINRKSVDLGVGASVSKRKSIQDAQFEAISASGVWSKSVILMGRLPGQKKYDELLKMQYDFNGDYNVPWAIGSLTTSKPVKNKWEPVAKINCDKAKTVSQCFNETLSTTLTPTADISEMEDVYLEFKVWATDKIGEVYLGGKKKGPTVNSNDPAHSDQMFVEGVQTAANTPVNIQSSIGCGDWQEQRWEDGGGYSGAKTPWEGTDFRYKVKGRCEWGKNVGVSLSK